MVWRKRGCELSSRSRDLVVALEATVAQSVVLVRVWLCFLAGTAGTAYQKAKREETEGQSAASKLQCHSVSNTSLLPRQPQSFSCQQTFQSLDSMLVRSTEYRNT